MSTTETSIAPGLQLDREAVSLEQLLATGVDLRKEFPGATAADFKRYPVLSEGGWFLVIKHQPTLRTVSRVPWRLRGPVELTSETLSVT
jgi:hypothetical protein